MVSKSLLTILVIMLYATTLCGMGMVSFDKGGVPESISEGLFDRLSGARDSQTDFATLYDYYDFRDFHPIWVGNKGISPVALDFISLLNKAEGHGLNPGDYDVTHLLSLVKGLPEGFRGDAWAYPHLVFEIETAFTLAFFRYAEHLVGGKAPPETAYLNWQAERAELDLGVILTSGLAKGHLVKSLEALSPQHRHYYHLKATLMRYQDILDKGLWETLNKGPVLQLGSSGARVELLKKGLLLTNDLDYEDRGTLLQFDDTTQKAVERFQKRHLLRVTGVVDAATLTAFNQPIEEKIDQIIVNLERLRWLPFNLGESYILVNIANYRLNYYDFGQNKMEMAVIVGRPYQETPLFSAPLSAVVVNPDWRIPPSIANRSFSTLLPLSNDALRPMGFHKAPLANGKTILVQEPGPKNALGKYKFVFKNPYHVYLHDTPDKHLFQKEDKRASSGCIRLQAPEQLAEALIPDHHHGLLDERQSTANWERQVFGIKGPTQVHLVYWTVWTDSEGQVIFGKDPYQRDTPLLKAINSL